MAMSRWTCSGLLLLLFAGGLPPVFGDQPGNKPRIDQKADDVLKKACGCLANLKQLGMKVEETFDEMSPSGQKIQLSNYRNVLLKRPNRLRVESEGDTAKRHFYYDGMTITLYDPVAKLYGTAKVPATIDAMFDHLHETHGFTIPTADLLHSDPYKALTEQVEDGEYLGLHRVGDRKCHHLAFRQRGLDWQLWVDAGERPLPLKFLITYRRQPGEPQYATVFTWDLSAQPAEDAFAFKAPAGAKQIGFVIHKAAPAKGKEPRKP
jgi:hypothetical protein